VFHPFEDWDWSLFVHPAQGFEYLATDRAGVQNDNGNIECEIQPPDGFWDDGTMHRYFDPLIGHTVTVVGTWVEDISHNNKTEIHPITSILDEQPGDLEKLIQFFVFCDTSTPHAIWRPHLPPHANQPRVGQFRVRFPAAPAPGHQPTFIIAEENNHALAKNFNIVAAGNDKFLEGTVQVDQGHGFYFARIYLGYWSDAENLGGVVNSNPAAVSWGPNRIDIFYCGQNNHLWHQWWDGAQWNPEQDLGGVLTPNHLVTPSGPAVASWGQNRLDVFYRGQNGHLWHKSWDGAQWNPEEDLGGFLALVPAAPAAVSWGPNRIDIFYCGRNNHLWHQWWDGAQWNPEEDLGGILTSNPAVASWGQNRLDVFYRGQNGHLWHRWWDGAQWNPEEDLGGELTSSPAAVSWGPNRIDIFYCGRNNRLWHKSWDGAQWNPEEDLGGAAPAFGPAVASWGQNRLDVFYTPAQGGNLWHKWFPV
jgi:hypothetical protein